MIITIEYVCKECESKTEARIDTEEVEMPELSRKVFDLMFGQECSECGSTDILRTETKE